MQEKLSDLEACKQELEQEIEAEPQDPVRLHPNLSQLYQQKVTDLHQALQDPAIRQEAYRPERLAGSEEDPPGDTLPTHPSCQGGIHAYASSQHTHTQRTLHTQHTHTLCL